MRWLRIDWRGHLTRSWHGDAWLGRDLTVRRHQAIDAAAAKSKPYRVGSMRPAVVEMHTPDGPRDVIRVPLREETP